MSDKILLADDSVTIQKVVELTFLEEPYQVVAVGSGDEAIARFDEVQPGLVIADVHMPGADGFEVCQAVRRKNPDVPVLLLVGTFEPFDERAVAAAGAAGFLKKPFDSQELRRVALDLLRDSTPKDDSISEVDAMFESDEPQVAATDEHSEPAVETPEPVKPAEPAKAGAGAAAGTLSEADVERIAKRVVELLGDSTVREVAWEVVPDLAELAIRERLKALESQVE